MPKRMSKLLIIAGLIIIVSVIGLILNKNRLYFSDKYSFLAIEINEKYDQALDESAANISAENKNDESTSLMGGDVYDKEDLCKFFNVIHKKKATTGKLLDYKTFEESIAYVYGDIDGDGIDDVVCFSQRPQTEFADIAIISVKNDRFIVLESELGLSNSVVSQDFQISGGLLIHSIKTFESNMDGIEDHVYAFKDGKLVEIASLLKSGYKTSASVQVDNSVDMLRYIGKITFEGSESELDENRWYNFTYEYSEIVEQDGEVVFHQVEQYNYIPEYKIYDIKYIDQDVKRGISGLALPNSDDVYEIQNLKSGMKIEDYDLIDVYLSDNWICYTIEGDLILEGELYVSELSGDIELHIENSVLSKLFRVNIDGIDYDYNPIKFAFFDLNILSEEQVKYIMLQYEKYKNSEEYQYPKVKMHCSEYNGCLFYNSENYDIAQVTSIEWLNPKLDK